MKLLLSLVTIAIYYYCITADNHYESILTKLIIKNAKGLKFSLEDMVECAKSCITNHIPPEEIESAFLLGGRKLSEMSGFHCSNYVAVNTANATAADLPVCQIPNVLPGTTLFISDCSSTCIGDQYLRLFDNATDVELLNNDDGKIYYFHY